MPRTLHIYPVNPSDHDIDIAVRAVWGEARDQGARGEQAVAGVIRNRATLSGMSLPDVIRTGGFSGYKGAALSLSRSDPMYRSIRANIEGVLRGSTPNPAGNATSYYSPQAMRRDSDGNPITPEWATDQSHVGDIGAHKFYSVPFPHWDTPSLPLNGFGGAPARPAQPVQLPVHGPRAMLASPDSQSALAGLSAPQAGAGSIGPAGGLVGPMANGLPRAGMDGLPQGGLPTNIGDYVYGPRDPGSGAGLMAMGSQALAAMGGQPPSPNGAVGTDLSYGRIAPDHTVTPGDIANLGYENAHILARILGPQPSPAQGQSAPDPQDPQKMLVAALMARDGYPNA